MRRLLASALAILLLAACARQTDESEAPEIVETARVPSPDSVVDAVITRASSDATTDFVYRVHIVPHRAQVEGDAPGQVRADHADSLRVSWVGPRMLDVSYEKARIFFFTNFWNSRAIQNFGYTVELRLRPAEAHQL